MKSKLMIDAEHFKCMTMNTSDRYWQYRLLFSRSSFLSWIKFRSPKKILKDLSCPCWYHSTFPDHLVFVQPSSSQSIIAGSSQQKTRSRSSYRIPNRLNLSMLRHGSSISFPFNALSKSPVFFRSAWLLWSSWFDETSSCSSAFRNILTFS